MNIQKINIKDNVVFKSITVPILKVMETVISVWSYYNLSTPTLTSAFDGKHRKDSLHYKDMAIDIRTKDLTPEQVSIAFKTLQDALGEAFDVVLESDHLHIEFQPK